MIADIEFVPGPSLDRLAEGCGWWLSRSDLGYLFELTHDGDSLATLRRLRTAIDAGRRAGDDPTAAAQLILSFAPWAIRSSRGDGSSIRITLRAGVMSRSSDGDRARHGGYCGATPDTPVRWQHGGRSVGNVVGSQQQTNGDLWIWCTLTDRDVIRRSIFGELSCSPTLATTRGAADHLHDADGCYSDHRAAEVRELALLEPGHNGIAGVTVTMATCPPGVVAATARRAAERHQVTAPIGAPLHVRSRGAARTVPRLVASGSSASRHEPPTMFAVTA